jgi:two-component system sensor histidine kinase/response regulator
MASLWDWLGTIPHCIYYGNPWFAGGHLVPSFLIFLAYVAIAWAIDLVRRRRGIPLNALAILFSAFIFLCGLGHFLDDVAIVTASRLWHWVANGVHTANAIVSLTTAVYLWRMLPMLINWPSMAVHTDVMETLEWYRERERSRLVDWKLD